MKRASGVLMHISSLWGDCGEGSFGAAAYEWIDFLADCGFSVWQVLPFCLPDEHNSPYKSYSAFSLNPNFIDLPTLAAEGLITPEELASAGQSQPWLCEFDRLSAERLALLARAAERFGDEAALDAFYADHAQIAQFCTFMALRAANGDTPWQDWTVTEPDAAVLRTWRFVEYTFFRQWARVKAYANERGISIIGDVPIYVALDSADVWASPEQFQLDKRHQPTAVAGVPPDYFCADGQLWGNPLYNWTKMKADGFAWWRARMAHMTELFDGVRIDHFRGIASYYRIPAGEETARNGKWVKGPGMAFVRAMREVCGDKLLIAEDLGVITPDVQKLVRDSGFPGMRVLQFAFLGDDGSTHLPHNYDNNAVAYTGTHDNDTLLGYVYAMDEATRAKFFRYCNYDGPWDGCRDAVLRTMLASHAGLCIMPVQDLLFYGSDCRFNTPGAPDGNWQYRVARHQLDEIDRGWLREMNGLYGR
ncbi:MAG: 4-alpha-glucanotransferase [Clostridia bacterium]|nr:4-alpha-glucanotransferase [Clostridia bacterium]